MSSQNIYNQTAEAGISNTDREQSFENEKIVNEQSDVLGCKKPMFDTTKLSSGPYSLKPWANPDQAQHERGYSQPEVNNLLAIKFPTTPQANPRNTSPPTSPLTRQVITTPGSLPSSPLSSPPISSPSSPPRISPNELAAPVPGVGTAGIEPRIHVERPKEVPNSYSNGYKPLYLALTSWDIFAYNNFGELEPGKTYSTDEIIRFLYKNPQHYFGKSYSPKVGGLTLRIQRTPQDFALEHGHPKAGLCRFADCKYDDVIEAGDIRVAFDELTKFIPNLNPQHNAGYVHLSCLEKKLDFPKLCIDLDVRAECRYLPLERTRTNHMALRDSTVLEHVQRFINFCVEMGRAPLSYPSKGYLFQEIARLEPGNRWKTAGLEWHPGDHAWMQPSKNVVCRIKRRDALAKMKAAKKKRAREEDDSEGDLEGERPGKKARRIMVARPGGSTRSVRPPVGGGGRA